MNKAVLAIAIFFVSSAAFSVDIEVNVCKVQAHTNDSAYLYPCDDNDDSSWVSKNNCGGSWVSWDMSVGQGQAMYSTALAAMLSDKTITLRVSGVEGECSSSYDVVHMVRINK